MRRVMLFVFLAGLCPVLAAVGWEENFDPVKPSWDPISAVWTDLAGSTATLTENDPAFGYGFAQSETITLDVGQYRELVISATAVDAGALYSVQILEIGGAGAYADAVSYAANAGTYIVDIAELMGWSGEKSFRINIWIDGEGRSVTFDRLHVRQPATVGWSEAFDPSRTTWLEDTCYWTDTPGVGAVLTESNPGATYGVAKSEVIVADVNDYGILYVKTSQVEAGGLYTIQIHEEDPNAQYAAVISYMGVPSEHAVDFASILGWSTVKKFRINIWLEGDNKSVTFDRIELRNRQQQERPSPILWEDHFDPVLTTWSEIGAIWDDLPGSTANLVEDNPGMTYGKVESESLLVNLDLYPELTVSVANVAAGGWLDVGVQEQGGAWTYLNVAPAFTGPGTVTANVAELTGWSGYKTFRIILWINGNAKSAELDLIRLSMNCGRDALPGDYCEDCVIDLQDLAEVGRFWMVSYSISDLEEVANHWLEETF